MILCDTCCTIYSMHLEVSVYEILDDANNYIISTIPCTQPYCKVESYSILSCTTGGLKAIFYYSHKLRLCVNSGITIRLTDAQVQTLWFGI